MASGVVQTTTDRAAALWLPVGSNPPEPPGDYDAQLAAATGPWIDQFRAFDATLDQHHPTGTAHHHLAILAIRPDKQGQGIGSLLLSTYHQMLDGDHGGTPTYLEAADPRNCQFYLRHGYTLVADVERTAAQVGQAGRARSVASTRTRRTLRVMTRPRRARPAPGMRHASIQMLPTTQITSHTG